MNNEEMPIKALDTAKEYIDSYGELTVHMISELFIEGVAGAIIPGVTSFIVAARTRRLEKNMKIFMGLISNRIETLEQSFGAMDEEKRVKFKSDFSEVIIDYISDEREEEKLSLL